VTFNWKGIFLWSNQFYGICAVLLAIETNLVLFHKMPNSFLLIFIHLATVVYYTHAYFHEHHDGIYDERSKWYQNNKQYLKIRQFTFTCICLWIGFLKLDLLNLFFHTTLWIQLILLLTVFISTIYYIPNFHFLPLKSFRHNGILKSISITWVWSIICCLLPIWFTLGKNFTVILYKYIFWNHFIYLFLFILVLSILFDIKDLYRDKKELINTIVAKHGIPFTINSIILPLLTVLLFFVIVGYVYQVNTKPQLIANMAILGLTYYITQKVIYQKTIHVNMLLIDGLIMIKALLSILIWQLTLNY
jgi:hypothetical protein